MEDNVELEPLQRLTRDLRTAAKTLSSSEVRYLVDYYYALQEDRIRAAHQMRTLSEGGEPHEVIAWLGTNTATIERNIKSALDAYTSANRVGSWSKSITGVGPIIAAGLLAHIDMNKAPTVGHIWSFAGLNPNAVWEKKEKRPWNARLKTLCWKIGESFVKVSGKESDVYGKVYLARKAEEQLKNDQGFFKQQAQDILTKKKIGKDTDAYAAYSVGKLPPAHIHARAKRYAVKLFLAHWHHVAHEVFLNAPPPKPYILTQEGHVHYIAPPNWPMTEPKSKKSITSSE